MSFRLIFLFLISILATVGLFLQDPIAQDLAYHRFADTRTLGAVQNWQNVLSNLPFIYVGAMGLMAVLQRWRRDGDDASQQLSWLFLFFGIFATGFGSSYYHWRPSNETLLWDRMPMSIGFSALFAGLIGERISQSAYRLLFWPLVGVAIATVLYWYLTELRGFGDLRPYLLVQFLPLLLIPFILLMYPAPYTHTSYLIATLGLYMLAKVCEYFDEGIFQATGYLLSGHALKHLVAACACGFLYLMFAYRTRLHHAK